MGYFENIAKLIRLKRLNNSKLYSQRELAVLLGFTGGQLISNVERGLCSIPLRKLKAICELLNIREEEIKLALRNDYAKRLDLFFDGENHHN